MKNLKIRKTPEISNIQYLENSPNKVRALIG